MGFLHCLVMCMTYIVSDQSNAGPRFRASILYVTGTYIPQVVVKGRVGHNTTAPDTRSKFTGKAV